MSNVTVALYIGADDGQLDLPRIENLIAKNHAGFTIWQGTGHWAGENEPMAMAIIADEPELISDTVGLLKSELHQEAIGVMRMPEMRLA